MISLCTGYLRFNEQLYMKFLIHIKWHVEYIYKLTKENWTYTRVELVYCTEWSYLYPYDLQDTLKSTSGTEFTLGGDI